MLHPGQIDTYSYHRAYKCIEIDMIGAQSPVKTEVFTICQLGLLTCYLKPLTRVASSIPARSHTFAEIDHKLISTPILLPSTDSRKVVVSYK